MKVRLSSSKRTLACSLCFIIIYAVTMILFLPKLVGRVESLPQTNERSKIFSGENPSEETTIDFFDDNKYDSKDLLKLVNQMSRDNYALLQELSFLSDQVYLLEKQLKSKPPNKSTLRNAEPEKVSKTYQDASLSQQKHSFLVLFTTFRIPNEVDDLVKYIIASNTIQALSYHHLHSRCVVFLSDKDLSKSANAKFIDHIRQSKCDILTQYERNVNGIPFLPSLFQEIESRYQANFVGFLNSDILLSQSLIQSLLAVKDAMDSGQLLSKVFLSGQRTNVDFNSKSSYNVVPHETQYETFLKVKRWRGTLMSGYAMDYFIASHGAIDWSLFPQLCVGRIGVDSYLGDFVYHNSDTIGWIDLTSSVLAIHQNNNEDLLDSHSMKRIDNLWNIERIGRMTDHGSTIFANYETAHVLGKVIIRPRADHHTPVILGGGMMDDDISDEPLEDLRQSMKQDSFQYCVVYAHGLVKGSIRDFAKCSRYFYILYHPENCMKSKQYLVREMSTEIICVDNPFSLIPASKESDPKASADKLKLSEKYIEAIKEIGISPDVVAVYGLEKRGIVNYISSRYPDLKHIVVLCDSVEGELIRNRISPFGFRSVSETPNNISSNQKRKQSQMVFHFLK